VVVGEVVGVVIGGDVVIGGAVIGLGVVAGVGVVIGGDVVAGAGVVVGVGEVVGLAGVLDAGAGVIAAGFTVTKTDHVPHVVVVGPFTWPAIVSPENR
jgi:NDP-sugar pyrophosphorylase family protein